MVNWTSVKPINDGAAMALYAALEAAEVSVLTPEVVEDVAKVIRDQSILLIDNVPARLYTQTVVASIIAEFVGFSYTH